MRVRARLFDLLVATVLAAAIGLSTGCVRLSNRTLGRVRPDAQLARLEVTRREPRGMELLATFGLEGLVDPNWLAREARLVVTLNDAPFATVVTVVRREGNEVAVPLHLDYVGLPPVALREARANRPVRLRLRGELVLQIGSETLSVPADAEQPLSLDHLTLPDDALGNETR
jgi:hypothetical protein